MTLRLTHVDKGNFPAIAKAFGASGCRPARPEIPVTAYLSIGWDCGSDDIIGENDTRTGRTTMAPRTHRPLPLHCGRPRARNREGA